MTDQEGLEERLRKLGEDFARDPMFPARVMVQVRQALSGKSASNGADKRRRWIVSPFPRYAAAYALGIALLVALSFWMDSGDLTARIAFADVQAAIGTIETAEIVEVFPERAFAGARYYYDRKLNVQRMQLENEIANVTFGGSGKTLYLDLHDKRAQWRKGSFPASSVPKVLKDLEETESGAVGPLGERTFDGRKLVGFTLKPIKRLQKMGMMQRQVWVDPLTRLPVFERCVSLVPNDLVCPYWEYTATFLFNQPIDASMFPDVVPDGYSLTEEADFDRQRLLPGLEFPMELEPRLAAPTIAPRRGIGPAQFGMSAEQVVELLGRPDEMDYGWKYGPDYHQAQRDRAAFLKQARKEGMDPDELRQRDFEMRQALGKILPQETDGIEIKYLCRGFELAVDKVRGLNFIFCQSESKILPPFAGKTTEGIGFGSTLEEVEGAYRKPDRKSTHPSGDVVVDYRIGRTTFYLSLNENRVREMVFQLEEPVEKE
jgi:hypothetical protein